LAARVESGSTLTGDLPTEASASIGGRLLDAHLSGQFGFAVTLEGENLATYDVLEKVNRLESKWRDMSLVRTVLGPGTAIRYANRWADDSAIPVPDEDDYYQSLLRFTELPRVLSEDNQRARILITVPDLGTSDIMLLGSELAADAREVLVSDAVSVNIAGVQWALYLGYAEIGADLRRSILFAFAAILLIMAFLFRSAAIPLLMLLPNLLPLLAGYAMLAVVGWKLSIVPAVVLALAVGIVVDDSIHMMVRMREELRRGVEATVAVRYAILHSGRAIMTSTAVLVAGFAVNGFSRFPINQTFALIGSVVLIAALVSDLVLLPALLILWQRRRRQ
jgi:predicted RND superfamily exporter protein